MGVASTAPPPPPHKSYATHDNSAEHSEAQYHLLGPGNYYVPPLATSVGTWESSFFGCLGAPLHCCVAIFLPCVSATYVAHEIGESWIFVGLFFLVTSTAEDVFVFSSSLKRDVNWSSAESYSSYLSNNYFHNPDMAASFRVASFIYTVLFAIGVMALRAAVRKHYNIPGSRFEDCWSSFLCSCCSLTQMSSHVEKSKRKMDTLPAYQAV